MFISGIIPTTVCRTLYHMIDPDQRQNIVYTELMLPILG